MNAPLTKAQIFEELIGPPGGKALPRFAEDCLIIRDKGGRMIPLRFSTGQQYIHEKIEEQHRRTRRVRAIILKGRQQYSSTYCTARHFKRIATEFGKRAYILTHEIKATENLFEMVERYYKNMPPFLRPHAGAASAKELFFDVLDSGYMVGTAGTKGTGRSGTVQFFLGSEVAFWDNAKDHMAGVGQAVPNEDDTEVILESTANGIGNFFHQKWQTAIAGERDEGDDSDYVPIFVPWTWQAEYRRTPPPDFVMDDEEELYAQAYGCDAAQMYWRRLKIRDDFEGDVSLFDQEYPATPELAFRAATPECLIPPALVARAMKNAGLAPHTDAPKLWGLDPAEYGDDRSALAKRQHRVVSEVKFWTKKGPAELIGLVAIEYDREPEPKPQSIFVDTSSTIAVCEGLQALNIPAVPVHFGEAAYEDHLYKNRRAEMWWASRDWLRDWPNSIPNDLQLQADATTVKMKPEASRRRQLESKEAMKKRGLKSPDGWDAVALTHAIKVAIAQKPLRPRPPTDWRVA
jgi:hypothetical protein